MVAETGGRVPGGAVAEKPVALVDPGHATPRVFLMTAAARVGGVEIGQTAVQAMARCREVVIRNRSLKQETAATEAVLMMDEPRPR